MRLFRVVLAGAQLSLAATSGWAQDTGAPAANTCTMRETSRTPLTIGDRELYVEPTVVMPSGVEVLLAGRPNYLFEAGPLTTRRDFTADSVFGAIIDAQGRARLVPSPIDPARVASTRAIPLASGGWAMVFAELTRPADPQRRDTIARLWYGEYNGVRWTPLEQLPAIPGHRIDLFFGSELTPRGDSLYLAIRARSDTSPNDVVLFARHRGRWSHSIVNTIAAVYVELVSFDSLGLAMVVVQADRSLPSDVSSMFLYAKAPSWRIIRKLVPGGSQPVFDPRLMTTPRGTVLSWYILDHDANPPVYRARAMLHLGETRDGPIVQLDSVVSRSAPIPGVAGIPLWVTDHIESSQQRTLRFLTEAGGRPVELTSFPNPFTGPFTAAAHGPSGILISGPLFQADPAYPRLVSLLIRLHVECSRRAP